MSQARISMFCWCGAYSDDEGDDLDYLLGILVVGVASASGS